MAFPPMHTNQYCSVPVRTQEGSAPEKVSDVVLSRHVVKGCQHLQQQLQLSRAEVEDLGLVHESPCSIY